MSKAQRTICQSSILKRGWLKTEIDLKLGEPDLRKPNPRDSTGYPMKLWYLSKVEAAEADPAHKALLAQRAAARGEREREARDAKAIAEARELRRRMVRKWEGKVEKTRQAYEWAKLVSIWLQEPEFDLSDHQPLRSEFFYRDEPTMGVRTSTRLFHLGSGIEDHDPVDCVSWRIADGAKARAVLLRAGIDWTDFLEFNGAPAWFGAETVTIKVSNDQEHRLFMQGDCVKEAYYWD